MGLFKRIFPIFLLVISVFLMMTVKSSAYHIISGEITWECITTGPDQGKFIFYLRLFRDCSQAPITPSGKELKVDNYPGGLTIPLTLNPSYPIDRTDPNCGFSCGSPGSGELTLEEYLFESAPTTITGTPPADGYVFWYNKCCRGIVNNIIDSETVNLFYTATMYPYQGRDLFPCYDSSPAFAELPSATMCSGYELRYNNNAIDSNLDSLSYQFVEALGAGGTQVAYVNGFAPSTPLPGPSVDPSYSNAVLDPITGQLEYSMPSNLQGRWTVAMAVDGWRCGQRISRNIREMNVAAVACAPNSITQVSAPIWSAPATANGFQVSVLAGDPVSFTLTGTDNDLVGGNPQTIELTVEGAQFESNLTNPNTNCINTPCATLSSVTPPSTATGSISTTFNWQTTCDHVSANDECGDYSSTYNFIFKFKDNFCPAAGINIVNVAVTVIGEPIIESPQPHCVSVDAAGAITINWNPVTDNNVPQSFVEYAIYHSTAPNGPFQEVGSVANIATGTYVHSSANAIAPPSASGPNYYLIRTRSGCNDAEEEAPVDTVSSIFLTVTDNITTADLSWTPVATPNLPSVTTGNYEVWKLVPGGVWTNIGSTSNLFYSDPVTSCQDELVTYRIELADDLPCISVSNEVTETLNNPLQPDPQPIDSVSVDPNTGLVTVCWPPSTSLNVTQYNIFINDNAFSWQPVDTVYGYNTNCWTDPNPAAATQTIWYQVTATSNCGTGVPAGSIADNTDHHENMVLEADFDSCQKLTELFWKPYWYWTEGIREYDVYVSKDAYPFTKIGTTADTTFVHEGLEASAEYCYFVRAIKNTVNRVTASSNRACIIANVPKRPDYAYSYETTVIPGNTGVEHYFFVDSTAGYLGFEIQRGTDPTSMNYQWFVNFDPNTRFYNYTDNSARPEFNSYYYSVIGVDSCELYADTLNMTRTILLEAEANTDRTNTLTWNAYESWQGNVVAYNIHREYNGTLLLLASVAPNQLTYTDSIEEIIDGDGNFCYYIEAVEGIGPPIGNPDPVVFSQTSQSNEDCALQPPNIFIPNAFLPEGVNNVFRPITVYADMENYLLQIYDRWGNRVFESTDPTIGWDGQTGGKEGKTGAYAYLLSVESATGKTYIKRGTITLIR